MRLNRNQLLALIGAAATAVALVAFIIPPLPETVVVVPHWANVYMMQEPSGPFPAFAKDFNAARHRTQAGNRIEVRPYLVNSGVILRELVSLANTGSLTRECTTGSAGGCPKDLPAPVIVTPAADHWLSLANYEAGHTLIETRSMKPLATSYVGIIMLREMAQCLGWPRREIAIADVVALVQDPRGWASCPTARTEWGQKPLMAFTDPDSSSTARSMLFALYAIAAGKPADQLTVNDVQNPSVVDYVTSFQQAVDHYVPDTVVLASKMALGPRYGHFFFNLENQLVTLHQGKVPVTVLDETRPRPLDWDMVMVYPKEGAVAHRHSAGLVSARWVSQEQSEAAQRWIDYLLADPQQKVLVDQGFRPTANVPYEQVINDRFGVSSDEPRAVVNPDAINPAAADAIVRSWGDVKKPGVVTFVVDTSGSMAGAKIEQARAGGMRALDGIDRRNSVGLLTFSDAVDLRSEVGPVLEERFKIATALNSMRASGNTALYDAIAAAIELTDEAPGDADAIRGIVVVTDGKANRGRPLSSIVQMLSRDETRITQCPGFEGGRGCFDERGREVPMGDVIGTGLAANTQHRIHIFYVGVGKDADLEVGRVLAEATGSAYKATTEQNLSAVLGQFSKYF